MSPDIFLRRCRVCKTKKHLEMFPRFNDGTEERSKVCQDCRRSERARRRPSCWRNFSPEEQKRKQRHNNLKQSFGISLVEYEGILFAQGGCCAICRRKPKPGQRRLGVDHDHSSGRVRGILCHACNQALASVGDDIEGAMRFVKYFDNKAVSGRYRFSHDIRRRMPRICYHKEAQRYYVTLCGKEVYLSGKLPRTEEPPAEVRAKYDCAIACWLAVRDGQ